MKLSVPMLAVLLAAPAFAEAPSGHAVAVLHAPDGKFMGHVHFTSSGGTVTVHGKVTGVSAGKHGFHVHEFGDCSAADFTSAGSHFNPTGAPHAAPDAAQRHVGDLGNLEAGADGNAAVDAKDAKLALEGASSIVGRAVIVHAKADDLKTQPTGDAGGRVACGVIGIAKAEDAPAAEHKH